MVELFDSVKGDVRGGWGWVRSEVIRVKGTKKGKSSFWPSGIMSDHDGVVFVRCIGSVTTIGSELSSSVGCLSLTQPRSHRVQRYLLLENWESNIPEIESTFLLPAAPTMVAKDVQMVWEMFEDCVQFPVKIHFDNGAVCRWWGMNREFGWWSVVQSHSSLLHLNHDDPDVRKSI